MEDAPLDAQGLGRTPLLAAKTAEPSQSTACGDKDPVVWPQSQPGPGSGPDHHTHPMPDTPRYGSIQTHGLDTAPDGAYSTTPYRWVILTLFCLFALFIQVTWASFQPITPLCAEYFGVTDVMINALSMSWMFVFLVCAPLSSYLFLTFGIRKCLLASGVIMVVSTALRWVGTWDGSRYWLLLFGQTMAGFGQVFTLGSPPLVSVRWFGAGERAMATTLGTQFGMAGMAVGLLVSPAVVHTGADLRIWTGAQAVAAVLFLVLVALLIKEGPERPPSAAAALEQHAHDGVNVAADGSGDDDPDLPSSAKHLGAQSYATEFLHSLLTLARNWPFVLLLFLFGVLIGGSWAIQTVLAQVIKPFGYGSAFTGTLGGAMTMVGIVGSLGIGALLDRYRCYKLVFVGLSTASIGCLVWTLLAIRPDNAYMLTAACLCLGLFFNSLIPVGMEYGAELTFPIAEATTGNLLMMWANGLSAALVGAMDALEDRSASPSLDHPPWGLVLFTGVCALATLLIVVLPPRSAVLWVSGYKRLAYEQAQARDGEATLRIGAGTEHGQGGV